MLHIACFECVWTMASSLFPFVGSPDRMFHRNKAGRDKRQWPDPLHVRPTQEYPNEAVNI